MRVVLLTDRGALLLSDVRRGADGTIRRGWVVNGHWMFETDANLCYAKDGERVVHSWRKPSWDEIEVPTHMRGDYNEIIQWARNQSGDSK